MSTIYQRLGVNTIINAKGTATRLSGGIMPAEVADAMREASQYCVDMAQLQGRASEIIAEVTGAEAGYVSSSWGEDRIVVMIKDALFKGERLLSRSKQGNQVLEQYVHELLEYVATNQEQKLSTLLQREISSTSICMNTHEQWVMFVFRLEG